MFRVLAMQTRAPCGLCAAVRPFFVVIQLLSTAADRKCCAILRDRDPNRIALALGPRCTCICPPGCFARTRNRNDSDRRGFLSRVLRWPLLREDCAPAFP